MSIRAKLQLSELTEIAWNPHGKKVKFTAQYDTSIPEDQRFSKATPSGEITLYVDNLAVFDEWKIGGFYYVDFTPVPEVEPSK